MAVYRHPNPGDLLICDFTTGFQKPEMVKKRPVVVISPRPRRSTQLCIVVPLSTSAPNPQMPYHHLLDNDSLPEYYRKHDNWAKCDMLYTVALDRLDRIMIRDSNGKRQYINYKITSNDLALIRESILHGLGLN